MNDFDEYKKELEIEDIISKNFFSRKILEYYDIQIANINCHVFEEPATISFDEVESAISNFNVNIILIRRSYFNRNVIKTLSATEDFLSNNSFESDFSFLIPYWVSQFEMEIKNRIYFKLINNNKELFLNLLQKDGKDKWYSILEKIFEKNLKLTFGTLRYIIYAFEKAIIDKSDPIYSYFIKNFNIEKSNFFSDHQLSEYMYNMLNIRNDIVHEGKTINKQSYKLFCNKLFGYQFLKDWIYSNNKSDDYLSKYLESLPKTNEEKKLIMLHNEILLKRELYKAGRISKEDYENYIYKYNSEKYILQAL